MKKIKNRIKKILLLPLTSLFKIEEVITYEKYKKVKKDREKLGKKYKLIQDKYDNFKEEKQNLKNEINNLVNQIRNKDIEINGLEKENLRLKDEIEVLSKKNRELEEYGKSTTI